MTKTTQPHQLTGQELADLATELRARTPRSEAVADIEFRSVPMRTCYEQMMRLIGPRDAVLDYAAFLFSDEGGTLEASTPPLTVEEAHVDDAAGTMTLVLTRGVFANR